VLPADPVDPVDPVVLAAREVAVDRVVRAAPADQVVLAVAVAVVTITEAAVVPVARVVPVAPEVRADPAVLAVLAVLAAAVDSVVPVGAGILLVRSASRAVGRPEVESPSAPSVKSSTTWKPRRSAAFGCPGVRVRRSGFRAVRR